MGRVVVVEFVDKTAHHGKCVGRHAVVRASEPMHVAIFSYEAQANLIFLAEIET